MGVMTMNMGQGNIERNKTEIAEYGDEVLCSGWNPVVGLTLLVPEEKHHSFPAELAAVDMELFLQKMYG